MEIKNDLLYTEEHEWIKIDGATGTVGITDYAQSELGDIVFIELPEKGQAFAKGDKFAVIESVKAASDIYLPISGEITEVNSLLEDAPETINNSPFTDGWIVKIKISDMSETDNLLSPADYEKFTSN